jgi:hypothetical protein
MSEKKLRAFDDVAAQVELERFADSKGTPHTWYRGGIHMARWQFEQDSIAFAKLESQKAELLNAIGWALNQADPQDMRNCLQTVFKKVRGDL